MVSITDSGNTSSIVLDGMGGAQLNGDFHVQAPIADESIANRKYVNDAISSIGASEILITSTADSVSINGKDFLDIESSDSMYITTRNSLNLSSENDISISATNISVTGDMQVQTPTGDASVANKKYVDDQIAALMARIEQLLASI